MSSNETKSVETVQDKKNRYKKWLLLLIPILLLVVILGYCAKTTVSSGELKRRLADEEADTIHLDGDVKIDEPLVIHGEKTITGKGKIILTDKLAGKFPDGKGKNNSWGMGCTKLDIEDTDAMAALFNVSDGAELTISGSIKVDAAKKANAIRVEKGGKLVVTNKAKIQKGRYVNIAINEGATAEIKGGSVLNAQSYGIINAGTLAISKGMLSGAETGAVLYNLGTATQSGGTIEKAGVHNVYVASGTFTMTGGKNSDAAKDGIIVQDGAVAEIEDGNIQNCVHGLCNSGEMNVGAITLNESGIMNYKTGVLEINGTTVDTSAVYCLANNGGKVTAKDFTAKRCDTCAIYNFSGDMSLVDATVTGSRDGNIANGGGNLTVKGAKLEKCRDKSIVVGSGKAVMEDVTIAGTSREKYGVYVYGGELYITDADVYDISSTAFKVDTGGYIEAKDIDMKDIAQIGFRADGGKVVAENVTMKDLGSHAIYNMAGDITIKGGKIDTIAKNAIQQRGGNTTLTDVQVENIGNHAAYIAEGKVSVTDSSFKNMEGNGFYLIEGQNEATLKNVALDGVKKQGINNQSKVTIDGLTIKNATQNGIFNKEKGTITAKNVEISNVGEHGVNNYNKMTLTDAKISKTGKGSNGLQNKGTLTIEKISVANSKNHGVYNTGTIKGADLTIKDAAKNGVYNNKGTFAVAKVTVNGAGEHGLNNAASMTVSEVTIKNTGAEKNNVQNSGTLDIQKATLTSSKNHGIYNTGTVSGKNVTIEKAAKNGVYNTKGTVKIAGLDVKNAGEHGINNEATVVISKATIAKTGAGKNCIQNSGNITVSDSTLKDSKNHGIYNTGTMTANDIKIQDIAKNGIYNDAAGSMKVNGADIKETGEHGINNAATITVVDANITTPGIGKNCIQNTGKATVKNSEFKDAPNHGIYNVGELKTEGTLTFNNIDANAVYNYTNGKVNAAKLVVNTTGGHGINNAAEFSVDTLNVNGVADNGIQNSGSFKVTGKANITDSGKHGLYNGKKFVGNNITIKNAYDLGASNSGDMEIRGLDILGTAHKAFYNSGYAEFYMATIDGTDMANSGAEYLVDNNGGVLDLTDTTLKNAKGTALHNRGNANTSVTNVVINTAGNYGTFVESGSCLSGDGFEINNITKGIEKAEGIPIKNAGKITMMDHVTLGADDPDVTGSAAEVNTTLGTIVNNAVVNDATTASYSGYDLVIKNATAGCAIYNKGIAYVTDFEADKAKDGIVSRYSGWATLAGNVTLTNSSRNPFTTYGAESKGYKNGITIASGANVLVDGANSHGINNKGSFLAADTDITIKNIKGTNINGINNNTGTMSLGNVTVDGVYCDITMYNESTINSNSGNGIMNSGTLTIGGVATISNLYSNPANSKTDNSNASGVVAKNGGSISGNGSIIVKGNNAGTVNGITYTQGVYNGIFTTKRTIDLKGNVSVDTVKNQGVYVADANGTLTVGGNLTVNTVGGNGIYVNNASGKLTVKGTTSVMNTGNHAIQTLGLVDAKDIVIDTTATGDMQGIYVKDGAAEVKATNITISKVGRNGIYINNTNGKLTATGTISINNVGGNGINNNSGGDISAANINIQTVGSGYNGITMGGGGKIIVKSSTVTPSGNITISDINQAGMVCGGNSRIEASGKVTVTNTGSYGIHLKPAKLYAQEVSIKDTKNIAIFMESNATLEATTVSVEKVAAGYQGIQLNHANTLKVGTMTIDNQNNKNGLRLYNNNSNPSVTIGKLTVMNCGEYGIAAQKQLTNANLNITEVWYLNCGKGALHGNIKSGVATPQLITQ